MKLLKMHSDFKDVNSYQVWNGLEDYLFCFYEDKFGFYERFEIFFMTP